MVRTLRKAVPAGLALAVAAALGLSLAPAQAAALTPRDADASAASVPAKAAATTEPGHPSGLGAHCTGETAKECLLPFPSDWWTRPDPSSATGRRVSLPLLAMPKNVAGLPMVPTEWNRRDGFSPGQVILAAVPGLDSTAALEKTGAARVTDMGAYARTDQPIVVIDADTGKRWPVWSEVDTTAKSGHDSLLMIHPSRNFTEGHRYIVALRNLRTADGDPIAPSDTFAAEVDGTAPASDRRAAHTAELVKELGSAGIGTDGLYLTWDFTVASAADTTGRLLSMRNRAFAQLGDTDLADGKVQGTAPSFKVTRVEDRTKAEDSDIARQVVLTVTVPCFIHPVCSAVPASIRAPSTGLKGLLSKLDPVTGKLPEVGFDAGDGVPDFGLGRFKLGKDGMPVQTSTAYQARVICNIPRKALTDPGKGLRVSLYGHGLLGSAHEVDAGNVRDMSQRFGVVYCATDWFGMAQGDIPNALTILAYMGRFPSLADRMQQGILNQLIVGRTLIAPGGISTAAPFQVNGHSVIDTSALYYDGNSQGGIYGGTVTAVSPDVRRAVLGVPGMDYSVLMPRSADFAPQQGKVGLATPFHLAYPDAAQRLVVYDLVQMLWDRSDPNGYAAHLTDDPLPDTPTHQVLMHEAFGDHQVADVMAETEARTAGVPVVWPALQSGRSVDVDPLWGLRKLTDLPSSGSALVLFDSGPVRTEDGKTVGVDAPPSTNVPDASGADPHSLPRAAYCGQAQKSAFLRAHGTVQATCYGPPYFSGTWTGGRGVGSPGDGSQPTG